MIAFCLSTWRHSVKNTKFYSKVSINVKVTTEFSDKAWTKNSIHRLLVKLRKFGTGDRRLGSSRRRSACTDENVDTVIVRKTNLRATEQSREISHEVISSFADYSQRKVHSTADWSKQQSPSTVVASATGQDKGCHIGLFTEKGALNRWLKQTTKPIYWGRACYWTSQGMPHWASSAL